MADEDVVEEAFRTAAGMIRALARKDLAGWEALWHGSEEQDRVAGWLAVIGAAGAMDAAHVRGISIDEWFAEQEALFNRRGSGPL